MNTTDLLFILIIVLQFLDYYSTSEILKNGGVELNPIMRKAFDIFGVQMGFLITKALVIFGTFYYQDLYANIIVTCVYTVIVGNNFTVLKKLKK